MVKRLRLSPLTAATGVRIPLESPKKKERQIRSFFFGDVKGIPLEDNCPGDSYRSRLGIHRVPFFVVTKRYPQEVLESIFYEETTI